MTSYKLILWCFTCFFKESALGHFFHRVAMSVCFLVSVFVPFFMQFFFRPLIGPQITWSVPGGVEKKEKKFHATYQKKEKKIKKKKNPKQFKIKTKKLKGRGLTNDRPGTDHVIWGPMIGLNKNWDKLKTYVRTYGHCD